MHDTNGIMHIYVFIMADENIIRAKHRGEEDRYKACIIRFGLPTHPKCGGNVNELSRFCHSRYACAL